jgi:hypothetical protein
VELPLKEEPILSKATLSLLAAEAMEADTTIVVPEEEEPEEEATEEIAGVIVDLLPLLEPPVVGATSTRILSEQVIRMVVDEEVAEGPTVAELTEGTIAEAAEVVMGVGATEAVDLVSMSADFMVI